MTPTIHGVRGCYRTGCRLPECVAAESAYQSARRPRSTYQVPVALADARGPGEWITEAACRTVPVAVFFADDTRAAVAVCKTCVVLSECRRYALAAPAALSGTWAATSQDERRTMRRRARRWAS